MTDSNIRQVLETQFGTNNDRPALWINGVEFTYRQFAEFFDKLENVAGSLAGKRIMIISERGPAAYAVIAASIVRNGCYIPVNAKWPRERVMQISEICVPDLVLVELRSTSPMRYSGKDFLSRCVHISADASGLSCELLSDGLQKQVGSRVSDQLYIMFTSGSTGKPKGVPLTTANASHYVFAMRDLFRFSGDERIVQSVELTFDLSVHDMLLCWAAGGTLISIPDGAAPLTPRFIKQLGATSCLMVPSAAAKAAATKLLQPNSLPSLRTSFFCGEALSNSLAAQWAEAAPNSEVINIYGPTEATIAFSHFDWRKLGSRQPGIVPIGHPIGEQFMSISDDGELLLSGPQVFSGYLADAKHYHEVFVEREGRRWYRSGDLASFVEPSGFHYRGRMDSQVKVNGFRIELEEVESRLRIAARTELVACVAPVGPAGIAEKIVAFVSMTDIPKSDILAAIADALPRYMVPSELIHLDNLPKNNNDKIDRLALTRLYLERSN